MSLLDYIKGNRKGKDAHHIERQAMEDPFLAVALEGFESVNGNHSKQIEALQKQVSRKLQPGNRLLRVWGIAASILICVSAGGYFLLRLMQKPDLLTTSAPPLKDGPSTKIIIPGEILDTIPETPIIEPEITMDEEAVQVRQQNKRKEDDKIVLLEKIPVSVDTLPVSPILPVHPAKDAAVYAMRKEMQESIEEKPARIQEQGTHLVHGKVVDEAGEPMAGVSIIQKGTHKGAVTNSYGIFTIRTDKDSPLEAKYLGFETKELAIDTANPMLITMTESRQTLDEVVVLGYGHSKTKKSASPEPIIGMKAYQKYIDENKISPAGTECSDKKGTVILSFSVDQNGNPTNISIRKSVCSGLDIEAMRLVKQGPKWTPGDGTVELKVKF